ncbi:MAG: hypothetical protein JSU06_01605 [Actinobacteria bacterium]|nr:hypothetical protein [Actinomycetota bacterium]
MSIVVTVNIDSDVERVEQVERDNPDVMATIGGAARKYMTSHRRTFRDGHVMDLDEFASKADYDAFFAEAGGAIKRYGELIGVAPRDTLWTLHEDA